MRPPPLPAVITCLVHQHNDAIGKCHRCQQPFCDICRSVWQDEILCLTCLNQQLEKREPSPGEARVQQRQAARSLFFALVGWLLFAISIGMFWSMREGRGERDFAILSVAMLFISYVPALLSLGQAIATIRRRGHRLTLATWGLVIAALQLGVMLSAVLLNISHN